MPEAAVDENNRLVFGKYNVRLSGVASVILAVTEAVAEQILPNNFLRLGIGAADAGHILAALSGSLCICHKNHSNSFTGVVCTVTWQFDIGNPNLCSVPTLVLVAGDLIHGQHQFIGIGVAQVPVGGRQQSAGSLTNISVSSDD